MRRNVFRDFVNAIIDKKETITLDLSELFPDFTDEKISHLSEEIFIFARMYGYRVSSIIEKKVVFTYEKFI